MTEYKKKNKEPRKTTEQYLNNVALFYVERYFTSSFKLRQYLRQKAFLSAKFHGTDMESDYTIIEQIIEKLQQKRYLDDDYFLESRINNLINKGTSRKEIVNKLRLKGFDKQSIEDKMATMDIDTDQDQTNLIKMADKLKIGTKYKQYPQTPEGYKEKQKDLAKLARRGFSFDDVQKLF